VEASKLTPNHDLLVHALETIIALLHPIAPFVTEAIWAQMPWHKDGQLIVTSWPVARTTRTKTRLSDANLFTSIQLTVQAARTIIAEEHLSKPQILTTDIGLVQAADLITRLGRVESIVLVKEGSGIFLGTQAPAWIAANDAQIKARKSRLTDQIAEKQAYLTSLEQKLSNERYVSSAPDKIVQETRERHSETTQIMTQLKAQLDHLAG
jgi:valyl-tRNA synthetase